ncbi:Rieske (2Fe-2S) protein [Microbacterium sp. TPU 3598]|uniref:Rieske (2Fe-2S) protein n=1 Tax=Microbacterium sp. TPU 3598 TaxID=1938334 RepID=UPI0012FD7A83|nr:Rieske 2Fe-2S domain-containing protein [Microbacterium sp. TPU 3598]
MTEVTLAPREVDEKELDFLFGRPAQLPKRRSTRRTAKQAPEVHAVTQSTSVSLGKVVPFRVSGAAAVVSIARTADALYAFAEQCPHDRAPLSDGLLTRRFIMCPAEGSLFDLASGAVVAGPASTSLVVFEVWERDGTIFIRDNQRVLANA